MPEKWQSKQINRVEDSCAQTRGGGGIDCESGEGGRGDGVGVTSGEEGGTTVIEQRYIF